MTHRAFPPCRKLLRGLFLSKLGTNFGAWGAFARLASRMHRPQALVEAIRLAGMCRPECPGQRSRVTNADQEARADPSKPQPPWLPDPRAHRVSGTRRRPDRAYRG